MGTHLSRRARPYGWNRPTRRAAVEALESRRLLSAAPAGYYLLETVSVPSSNTKVKSSRVLASGVDYKLVVSGTVTISNSGRQADAEFGQLQPSLEWASINHSDFDWGIAVVPGPDTPAKGSSSEWGGFSSDHQYARDWIGTGQKAAFKFMDDHYPDNSGSLDCGIYAPVAVKLTIANVADADKYQVGGYIPLNADDDNGSVITNHVAAVRDLDKSDIAGENDLVALTIGVDPNGVQGKVRLTDAVLSGDNGAIKIWDTPTKTNEITLPKMWAAGQQPQTVYIEGFSPSTEERSIELIVQFLDGNGNAIVDENGALVSTTIDKARVTVTPILKSLDATVSSGFIPGLRFNTVANGWLIDTNDGPGRNGTTFPVYTSASAFAKGTSGSLRLTQNSRWINNLPGGKGADLGGGQTLAFGFVNPNFGKTLVDEDLAANAPFNDLDEQHTSAGEIVTVTCDDSPKLPINVPLYRNILPAPGGQVSVDVSPTFDLYAAWEFDDHSAYFLGKTTWDVHFQGIVGVPAGGGNPSWAAGGSNGINGGVLQTLNVVQSSVVVAPPTGNDAGSNWQ